MEQNIKLNGIEKRTIKQMIERNIVCYLVWVWVWVAETFQTRIKCFNYEKTAIWIQIRHLWVNVIAAKGNRYWYPFKIVKRQC